MIKAFIFDLDGVLISTDKYHYLAWKNIADKLNIPFDENDNNALRGVSREESLELILRKKEGTALSLSPAEKKKLLDYKNSLYRASLSLLKPENVDKDVRNTLITLKKQGYKTGLGSSSKNARYILEKADLFQYFDAITDGSDISKSKPDPQVFTMTAERLNVKAEECAVVEDSRSGIDAALSGKMLAIGIGDAKDYKKTQYPISFIKDLLSLTEILKNDGFIKIDDMVF